MADCAFRSADIVSSVGEPENRNCRAKDDTLATLSSKQVAVPARLKERFRLPARRKTALDSE